MCEIEFKERIELVKGILDKLKNLIHILSANGSKANIFYSLYRDRFESLIKALEHAHFEEFNKMLENLIEAKLLAVADDKTKNCIDLHVRTFDTTVELAKCINIINPQELAKSLVSNEANIYRGLIAFTEEVIESMRFEIVNLRILLNDLEDKIKQLKSIVNQLESR